MLLAIYAVMLNAFFLNSLDKSVVGQKFYVTPKSLIMLELFLNYENEQTY